MLHIAKNGFFFSPRGLTWDQLHLQDLPEYWPKTDKPIIHRNDTQNI